MDDKQIVDLYWSRDEAAVRETAAKYGSYCGRVAGGILADWQDVEECVSDTWLGAWNAMPPHRPSVLSTFLGKITRRISINRWNGKKAGKRGNGEIPLALDELAEAVPSRDTPEHAVAAGELAESIDRFLASLPQTERDLFVCRYWFLAPIAELGGKFGFSQSKTKSALLRTRSKLKAHLEKEGFL